MLSEVQKETAITMQIMEKSLPQIEKGLALTVNSNQLLECIEQQATSSSANVGKVVNASISQIQSIDYIASQIVDATKSTEGIFVGAGTTRAIDKNTNLFINNNPSFAFTDSNSITFRDGVVGAGIFSITAVDVPEPGSIILCGLMILGLLIHRALLQQS